MKTEPSSSPSLWAAVSKPITNYPPLVGVASTDVVIVGAGFTGLSAALHLRRAGVPVIVVEAAKPGWGASGRNNGQVIPTLSRADPNDIIARHRLAGERFVSLIKDSAQGLFDVVREERLDAEAEQSGWVQPAHSPGRMRLAETRVQQWQKVGANVAMLDRAALAKKIGSDTWHGGWWAPSGGHINPLALARELARRVVELGGIIHSNTPAIGFSRAGTRWLVTAAEGRIDARAIVLATNAFSDTFAAHLAPDLSRQMLPVQSWQMATQPIPETVRAKVLPERTALSDTRAELRFARYDARHRLVTGGAALGTGDASAALRPLIAKRLIEMFPALADVPGGMAFDHIWSGPVGITSDGLPRIHRLGPDGYAWAGCNGRGVALAMSIGREFARGILGTPKAELALPFTDIAPIRFHAIAKRLAPYGLLGARRRDRKEFA